MEAVCSFETLVNLASTSHKPMGLHGLLQGQAGREVGAEQVWPLVPQVGGFA
jgi:hypothetical protein